MKRLARINGLKLGKLNNLFNLLIEKKKLMFFANRDQFILQEDGYGRIVGRLKEMIIRGGENIYPKEIEDYLNSHPDILETHVSFSFDKEQYKIISLNYQ